MRIDPSQLSEPLAHILGAGATDAAAGGKASSQTAKLAGSEGQLDQLDQLLLKRLRMNAAADAANSVVTYQDAKARIDQLKAQAAADPAAATQAQGTLDSSRVRGLLDR
ncbi:MAG: hypothetical protein JWM25_508 [Thermoleophilia bacterium]|nr:hypothetical protein [Thermoleophilia bacterium]MCZ4495925.1 hypothetical protein [Thermoleophilia bacterium]